MSELLLYHNEELEQIFRKRFNDFDETYEGAGADTEKILKSQMMVRYILINTESFNIIAKVIDDHIKEFGNDAHRLATYLSLITDIIIKGCKTTNSPEMFKENLQNQKENNLTFLLLIFMISFKKCSPQIQNNFYRTNLSIRSTITFLYSST